MRSIPTLRKAWNTIQTAAARFSFRPPTGQRSAPSGASSLAAPRDYPAVPVDYLECGCGRRHVQDYPEDLPSEVVVKAMLMVLPARRS